MNFFFLSQEFYDDYLNCSEIEQKIDRPYVMIGVKINNVPFAVPLRSNINHKYVLWTDVQNRCGVDFSKAIVLTSMKYVDISRKPHIRQNEFESLRGQEQKIEQKMRQYIAAYKKAKARLDVPRNQIICQYSTLQYFEEYI